MPGANLHHGVALPAELQRLLYWRLPSVATAAKKGQGHSKAFHGKVQPEKKFETFVNSIELTNSEIRG